LSSLPVACALASVQHLSKDACNLSAGWLIRLQRIYNF
jgi:hypothetical protein